MRRISALVLLALGLLMSGLALTTTTSAANGDDDNDNDNDNGSLSLTAISKQFKALDLGAKGESLGDQIVFSDNVYEDDHRVGTLDGFCTTTRVVAKTFHQQCVVTLRLPGGQLTSQGVIRIDKHFDNEFTIAVTGGTGDFVGADGEAHVRFVSDTKTKIEVDLGD